MHNWCIVESQLYSSDDHPIDQGLMLHRILWSRGKRLYSKGRVVYGVVDELHACHTWKSQGTWHMTYTSAYLPHTHMHLSSLTHNSRSQLAYVHIVITVGSWGWRAPQKARCHLCSAALISKHAALHTHPTPQKNRERGTGEKMHITCFPFVSLVFLSFSFTPESV